MVVPRRNDLVLESVRRLLRMGATPNLLNLLQKQHPADLAQVFAELNEKDCHAVFNVLVERNGKLAAETLSELGPEKGSLLLVDRPADDIARLLQEIRLGDSAALFDYLPEDVSSVVLDLIGSIPGGCRSELLDCPE